MASYTKQDFLTTSFSCPFYLRSYNLQCIYFLIDRFSQFLNDADKLRGYLRDIHSVKSKSSRRSRNSLSSVTSAKLKVLEEIAAALEVKASFLKEKQALKMATEELELRQQIAEAKPFCFCLRRRKYL